MTTRELPAQVTGQSTGQSTRVEAHGVDRIPDGERTASPREFLWIWHSAQFSFGTVVLGSVPVSFGLSWTASVTAILVGLLIGTAVFAPLVLFGKRTGANDPVSSGAHFGVRGRVVANVITIVVAIGFFSIAVWTGATAILAAGQRVLGTPAGPAGLAVTMPLMALAVVVVAVYGYGALLATYKAMTVIGGLVLLALVVVLLPRFDPGHAGGPYALGDFWRTWLLAVSFSATLPVSYSTFQGDYSRYLSPRTRDRAAVAYNGAAMYVSNALALIGGAYVTTMLKDGSAPWILGVADVVPRWFAVVVIAFGFAGTLPQAALCLYAAGLSANSILWRLRRVGDSRAAATWLMWVLGVATLYVGAIVFDAVESISTFVLILLVLVSPWSAIMLVGFALRRGRYDPDDLYGFARPGHRGRYWFTGGFNLRALGAFVPAVVLGLLFVDNTIYTGPLAGLAGGVDLSCLVPFCTAALLYAALCLLFPERTAVPTGGDPR
ncbi:purine-cytosine permease family protein [Microbispora sitophila]|uniref:purine-cytosine permease family protein n=1 Tax=Microbispora sitophila TaxID=2771537 RepID=UPI00299F7515|nr:cytosine permease [Microbispora sitophila]